MKAGIRPQELYYLCRPVLADPVEMLKFTFQGLCLDGTVDFFYKYIYINKHQTYKRKRPFLRLGQKYDQSNTYSKAETLLLSKFTKPELRLHEIRHLLMSDFDDDIMCFKRDHVYDDVIEKGYCFSRWILTGKGRKEKKHHKGVIADVENNVDLYVKDEKVMKEKLDALGANIILLDDEVLEKLKKNVNSMSEMSTIFDNFEFDYGGSYVSYGGFGGGYGGYGGGGGFGGFGGGSFGGAGSGGSW